MKFFTRIAAVLSAAVIIGNAQALSAYSVQQTENLTAAGEFTVDNSTENAVVEVRNAMKTRETNFSVNISCDNYDDLNSTIKNVIKRAVDETGCGTEGDYIRWCIKEYRYSSSYSPYEGIADVDFTFVYNSTAEQEQLTDKAVDKILAQLSLDGLSDYDKIKKIYGYITQTTKYADSSDERKVFTAYGAAVEHNAVCQGYSLLLYRLLQEVGIPCRIVYGIGNEGRHAWNIVKLEGIYYYLDSTWDAGISEKNYRYFLRGLNDLDSLSDINSHTLKLDDGNTAVIMEDYKNNFLSRYRISNFAYDKNSQKLGDLDNDGLTTAADASAILNMYVELSTVKDKQFSHYLMTAADVDGDEVITAADASMVLGYYSYLSTTAEKNIISLEDFVKKTQPSA